MAAREGAEPGTGERSSPITAQRVGIAVLVAAFAAWAVANSQEVTVDFVVVDAEVRLFVALLVAGLLGTAIGYLSGRRRHT